MTAVALTRGNLPADLTSFVGRRNELADLRRQLGEFRMLTLTGMGGVGKTRLALRLSDMSDRAFPHGVWLVELAALQDSSLVAQRIASVFSLRVESSEGSLDRLVEFLAPRQVLIVLDNCEHLLDGCGAVVETLLRACPQLRLVATSRQPLGVPGERVIMVTPLRVPAADQQITSPGAMSQYDAVSLFVDRATAVAPGFGLTTENLGAVAGLLARLDGIPLAIELAAARVRVLTPQQIIDCLDDGYQVLRSVSRTALPHRRSLRALIDWSFDLSTAEERTLWAQLSVFPNDFDLEAAAKICSVEGDEPINVLEAVAGLVDKSILTSDTSGETVRYRLPETLREYGAARLADSRNAEDTRVRHCEYYGQLARTAWREWFGPRQLVWSRWMDTEYGNLAAALDVSMSNAAPTDAGLSVLPALAIHWLISGSLDEGRRFIDRALTVETALSRSRALMLDLSAWLAINQGDFERAKSAAHEARELAAVTHDAQTLGHANQMLGTDRLAANDIEAAQRHFDDALEASGRTGIVAAAAFRGLAAVARKRDDPQLQAECLLQSAAISVRSGESWDHAATLWSWALLEWEQGKVGAARDRAAASLRLKHQFGDRVGIAQSIEILAWCSAGTGEFDRSCRLLGAADRIRRDVAATLAPDLVRHHAECEAKARSTLGDRAFEDGTSEIARHSLDDLIHFALDERVPAPRSRRSTDPLLTRREREIADLVAEGMSNREIARRMVIAQRTAEGHIEHILVKLGFTSRTQIASWVLEQRHRAN
jgi:predicted ATPase/DNA-binding CsgD family transcriptional regulator